MAGCKKCKISWQHDDAENIDRDDRMMRHIVRTAPHESFHGHGRAYGGHGRAHGGALKNLIVSGLRPHLVDLTVPIGFAKYVSPVVDPNDYRYVRMSGWRVAIHRGVSDEQSQYLINHIFQHGPQSVNYVRIYDTLVPASLGPGDRMTLARHFVHD